MCLAVPMIIDSIDGSRGVGRYSDGLYDIRLDLIENPQLGEYVMVHAGVAIDRLDEAEAVKTLEVLRQIDEISG